MNLNDKQHWLLILIDSTPHIDDKTRLQKYAFLASKMILKDESAYKDWESHNFGAYSSSLDQDVRHLEKNQLVSIHTVKTSYGQHDDYAISGKGRRIIHTFKAKHRVMADKIKRLTRYYFDKPLDELLADAYALFPEYTTKSTIRARVRNNILKRDARLRSEIVLPYTDKKIGMPSITTSAKTNPFPYNDMDLRKRLAEQAGLSGIPPIDPSAYDELSEIFADKKFLTYNNIEEIMENIRA
ncbi:MAG: hypothetical protein D9C04_06440 [Nitrosopumilus sp. B06]|nr:MAG: hypothetical protein D9C04_06440 [Nitrosopumilus sp. B06]